MVVEQAVDVQAFPASCETTAQRFREYSPLLCSRADGFWIEDKDWSLVTQSLLSIEERNLPLLMREYYRKWERSSDEERKRIQKPEAKVYVNGTLRLIEEDKERRLHVIATPDALIGAPEEVIDVLAAMGASPLRDAEAVVAVALEENCSSFGVLLNAQNLKGERFLIGLPSNKSLSVFTAGNRTRADMQAIEARYEDLRQHEWAWRSYQSLISSLAGWADSLIRQRIARLNFADGEKGS